MSERKIRAPFFVVNPKSFLYGEELYDLASHADKLAQEYELDILFTGPLTELAILAARFPNLIVTSQHMDSVGPGDSMGLVLPESLKEIGVEVVVINHADRALTFSQIIATVKRAKELGLKTLVCADSILEAKAIAELGPDILLAEPTELIGQAQITTDEYVLETTRLIKEVNPNILVEQGAGIRTEDDVRKLLELGADGVGLTSGIVKADNPKEMMEKMVMEVVKFK